MANGQFKSAKCAFIGCFGRRDSPQNPLGCKYHWFHVPEQMKQAITEHHQTQKQNQFHQPYWEACADAIEYVADLEGLPGANRYRENAEILRQAKGMKKTA